MANTGGTITDPVSISDVRTVLGCGSSDLGILIAAAKEGGADYTASAGTIKTAFKLKGMEEAYPSLSYGEIIPGAKPFWNIWSAYGPGYLGQKTATSDVATATCNLIDTLTGDLPTYKNEYYFRLARFDEYNHQADEPVYEVTTQPVGLITVVQLKLKYGSYDWAKALRLSTNQVLGARLRFIKYDEPSNIALVEFKPPFEYDPDATGEWDIIQGATLNQNYGSIHANVHLEIAIYTMNQSTRVYDFTRSLDLSAILGTTLIDNTTILPTTATLTTKLTYLTDTTVTARARPTDAGKTSISGSYLYPLKNASGQPNIVVPTSNFLRVKVVNTANEQVLYTQDFTGALNQIKESDMGTGNKVRIGVTVNYLYADTGLRFDCEFIA